MSAVEERRTPDAVARRQRRRALVFAGLVALQFCFSAILAVLVLLFQFAFDSCTGTTCDFALGGVSMWTGWIGITVALVATIGTGLMLHRRGRATWWLPVVGSGLAVAMTGLSYSLILRATGLSHL